jgi:hypothetical protein
MKNSMGGRRPTSPEATALWRDLWAHVTDLRAENRRLRRQLGLSARRYKIPPVLTATKPRLLTRACASCGTSFGQPRRRGRPFTRCERCRR